ncbi:MAG TPA: hypothetical protein VGR28_05565 [Candidatus Thermoplasmatota archaeon]|jgi:hypothetical protein|nr:hypothetical protein [Candidatus Thermoplasmatota archaeon]
MRNLVWLVVLAALGGCLRAEQATTTFTATGSNPVAFAGYDYAGATALAGAGDIQVSLDAASDTGTVVATFTAGGRAWRAEFTRFAETRPFHQGGVRLDFPEHGDSGNGDALLPTIHALAAGWGQGTVSVDGAPIVDPSTGNATFNLHVMATDTGPRDPATNKITKQDGSTPYDPAAPADARVTQGLRQLMINVQSAAAMPADANVTLQGQIAGSDQVTGATALGTIPVANAQGSIAANVTLAGAQGPLPALGQFHVALLDPAGTEVQACDVAPGAAAPCALAAPAPLMVGDYTVQATGSGIASASGVALVDYPDSIFWHVVYAMA